MMDWLRAKAVNIVAGGYVGSVLRTTIIVGVTWLVASGQLKQEEANTFLANIDPIIQAVLAIGITKALAWIDRAKRNAALPLPK